MADDKDDDLYDQVSAMADRLGLEGSERNRYVHEHMTRAGYDAVPQYVRREDDDDRDRDSDRGSFFGRDRDRDRDRRPRGRDDRRDRDRPRGGGDDWYS
jgi:hypothetical protein